MKSRDLIRSQHLVGRREPLSYPHSNDFLYAAGKAFAALLLGMATINGAVAQENKSVYLSGKKHDMATNLITGNYGDAKETPNTTVVTTTTPGTTTTKVTHSAVVNSPTAYIHGEDKYLKTKEDGHRYDEFDVYDINGKDKDKVVLGLLTNTLDRAKRFDDKGAVGDKMTIATTMIDKLDDGGKVITGQKVRLSAIRFNDKIFLIIGENDYRYLDGKKIVGDTKLADALAKGKPITEMTFFYELQNAGYIKDLTAKQFAKLDIKQKERLLNNNTMAGL